jgi:glycosyltransferase involved in cell wall biosynthesis
MRVLFLIRSLRVGGAERQLLELVRRLSPARVQATVAVMYSGGALFSELEACTDVRHVALGKRGRWDFPGFMRRLLAYARELRPDVVHGYLDAGNLLALMVGRHVRAPVVFGVRASLWDMRDYDVFTTLTASATRRSGRFADLVIANSEAGRSAYIAGGVPPSRIAVVPNGIDGERFRPDPEARRAARAGWGVTDDEVVIGKVARFDPVKDHLTFVRAAARVLEEVPHARFVCAGDGVKHVRERVWRVAEGHGIQDRFIWQPESHSDASLYAGFDVHVSASYSEGFSNALAEAMACGVPCVATDVGDSAALVGDTGLVVPPRDPDALAGAIARMAKAPRLRALGTAARARIDSHYGLGKLVDRTTVLLERVARGELPCT